MTAIVKNIRAMWNVRGENAEGYMKTIQDHFHEMAETLSDTEAFLRERPELMSDFYWNCYNF